MINLHPGIILLVGAFLALILRQQLLRQGIMILAPALALVSLLNIRVGTSFSYNFINDMELIILKVDRLSWLFGLIFCIVALVANIYALHVKRRGENVAGLAYAGCSLGVVFAGDWITMIFFWEVMAVASVLLIWNRKVPEAIKAGFRYILVHFFGGNLLLAGIFLKVSEGQIEITSLTNTNDAAFWLILLGISINAAIPPLHAWLTDAYPEGTVSGSVFLSAFTTKVAVYALIRIFSGTEFLIWAGVIMALYGVVYAVLENDIRRLLAYHIVTQGVISGLNRTITVSDGQSQLTMEGLIQTDASINSGNSGGPLLNSAGQVIGINSAKAQSGEGLGFAIPINTAKPIVDEIKTKGEFKRSYIGIRGGNVADFLQINPGINLGTKTGVYVAQIYSDSPAAKVGLKEGDIIIEVEGEEVRTMSQLISTLFRYRPGDTIDLTVLRMGRKMNFTVTLTSMDDTIELPRTQIPQ